MISEGFTKQEAKPHGGHLAAVASCCLPKEGAPSSFGAPKRSTALFWLLGSTALQEMKWVTKAWWLVGGTADPLSHFARTGALAAVFWANVDCSNCSPAPCSSSWATRTLFCAYAYCAGLELFWDAWLSLLDNAIPTFVKCFVVFGTEESM